jgi:hypothetical protein
MRCVLDSVADDLLGLCRQALGLPAGGSPFWHARQGEALPHPLNCPRTGSLRAASLLDCEALQVGWRWQTEATCRSVSRASRLWGCFTFPRLRGTCLSPSRFACHAQVCPPWGVLRFRPATRECHRGPAAHRSRANRTSTVALQPEATSWQRRDAGQALGASVLACILALGLQRVPQARGGGCLARHSPDGRLRGRGRPRGRLPGTRSGGPGARCTATRPPKGAPRPCSRGAPPGPPSSRLHVAPSRPGRGRRRRTDTPLAAQAAAPHLRRLALSG